MVARQSPLVGLEMSPEVAKYVAVLEGRLASYAIQDAKYRALLELLTGDSWEDSSFDASGRMIMQVAEEALVKGGMSRTAAKTTVAKRWNASNVSTKQVSRAVPLETVMPQRIVAVGTMKERLQEWKTRNQQESQESQEPL